MTAPGTSPSRWTPERYALLMQLKANGRTHKQIAAKLGVSEKAVWSKLHRSGATNSPLWPPEREALLKERWFDGKSSSGTIAAELGITRNAVLGKLSRMGLLGDQQRKPVDQDRRSQRTVADLNLIRRIAKRNDAPPLVPAMPLLAEIPGVIPPGQRRSFFELGSEHCRWPIGRPGAPDFYYCASDTANFPRRPYCQHHAAIAGRKYDHQQQRV